MTDIKGTCVGIRLKPRGSDDNHICLTLMIEDDGIWHETDFDISSFWLADLASVVAATKQHLETNERPSENGYGHCFK